MIYHDQYAHAYETIFFVRLTKYDAVAVCRFGFSIDILCSRIENRDVIYLFGFLSVLLLALDLPNSAGALTPAYGAVSNNMQAAGAARASRASLRVIAFFGDTRLMHIYESNDSLRCFTLFFAFPLLRKHLNIAYPNPNAMHMTHSAHRPWNENEKYILNGISYGFQLQAATFTIKKVQN